jgi:hypothetical protein
MLRLRERERGGGGGGRADLFRERKWLYCRSMREIGWFAGEGEERRCLTVRNKRDGEREVLNNEREV